MATTTARNKRQSAAAAILLTCLFSASAVLANDAAIDITIDLNSRTGLHVSDVLVSNSTGRRVGHDAYLLGDPVMDEHMQRLYGGRTLAISGLPPLPEQAADGSWWNFAALDVMVLRAKNEWGVKELHIIPGGGYDRVVTGKNGDYTDEDLELIKGALRQLLERYAPSGDLHIKWWRMQDEWLHREYWRSNLTRFSKFHAELSAMAKQINPDILVGGPGSEWPRSADIESILEDDPNIDFIVWNQFMSGHADTPFDRIFHSTWRLQGHIELSRRLSRDIRGKELPVIASIGPNDRTWDPPDLKMATPWIAVWKAMALSQVAKGGGYIAYEYALPAGSCGVMGRHDWFMVRTNMQPTGSEGIFNVRAQAYVHEFFMKHVEGKHICEVNLDEQKERIVVLAAVGDDGQVAVVVTNFGDRARTINLRLENFNIKAYEGMQLPANHIFGTPDKITYGYAFVVNAAGEAKLVLPPYSFEGFTAEQVAK